MISLLVIFFNKQRLDRAHVRLGRTAKIFEKYAILMRLIEKEEFNSLYLNQLKSQLSRQEIKASKSLKKLFKLLNNFDVRYNVFVTILLNSLMVFDLQIFCRLEKWKSMHKGVVGGWFEALAEMDGLLGYAVYAFNNQATVAYPEVSDQDFAFEAVELGHPLLNPSTRVNNSVKFTGKPNVIIVTGANMAGKSTFLRTLSVILILAMNGAPVCAKSFRFTPCDIMSSIKIQDSLSNHESYFYAELLRIKELIDHVKSHPKTLVILDEILRGTNTKDKQLGSLGLLEKLISQHAVAIIATHDLEIGKLADIHPDVVANYCFEVELQNDQLIFDYKLKQGISSKLNASFLMKKMEIID
jgi:DNA mismatch repair ATPase MutS